MAVLSEIVSSRVRAEIFRILFGIDPVDLTKVFDKDT